MCDLHVGRVSVTLGDVRVSTLTVSGNTMQVGGKILGTEDEVGVLIEQFRGLVNSPDEPFIPVYWTPCDNASHDPGLMRQDGYYTVDSISTGMSRLNRSDFDMTVTRIHGFSSPLFESVVIGGQRKTSTSAGVTGLAWHAIPGRFDSYETAVLAMDTVNLPANALGGVQVFSDASNHLYNARPTWHVAPRRWYRGAAELRVAGELVVGRQAQNVPTEWQIGNGLVRLAGSADGKLITERWDGGTSAWVGMGEWQIGRRVEVGLQLLILEAPHTMTVLRNDPARVTVRCAYNAESVIPGSYFIVNVDYSLRRGSTVVEVTLTTKGRYQWGFVAPFQYTAGGYTHDSTFVDGYAVCGVSRMGGAPQSVTNRHTFLTATIKEILPWVYGDCWGWGYLSGQTEERVARLFAAAQDETVKAVAR